MTQDTDNLDETVGKISRWLTEHGPRAEHLGRVMESLCPQIQQAGVPLARMTMHLRALHSERMGTTRIWSQGESVQEVVFDYGSRTEHFYQASPIKVVHETREPLSLRLDETPDSAFGVIPDLRALGISHYLVLPVVDSKDTVHAISYATKAPNGWSVGDLGVLHGIHPTLVNVLEIMTLKRTLREVLGIYVGRGPGERILQGEIRRGQVQKLEAAILFCDLRGFTSLSSTLEANELVRLLNSYFDCVVPAVQAHGGEVLKFMGDAVLAIFPRDQDYGENRGCCEAAFLAARDALFALARLNRINHGTGGKPLHFGVSLHVGEAAYGNVGSTERQDFTTIGRDINLASRIAKLCSLLSQPLLVTTAFKSELDWPTRSLGSYELKGLEGEQAVFAPEEIFSAVPPP